MGTPFFRAATVDCAQINEEKRSVPVAFSSETPCRSWDNEGEIDEVLDHSPECVDMTRAKDGLPLMLSHMDHDATQQVGIIEDITIGADRVMRGNARFGSSQLANDIFADVKTGIRKTVSVGYERTGIVSSEKVNNRRSVRFRWLPLSVSVVPVPADVNVGFGRNKPKEQPMPENAPAAPAAITAEDRKAVIKTEQQRQENIRAAVRQLSQTFPHARGKFEELETEAIGGDFTVETFNARMLALLPGVKPQNPITFESLGASLDDKNQYSLGRAIQWLTDHPNGYDTIPGVEGEIHREMRKRNKDGSGLQVPFDAQLRSARTMRRDLTATGGLSTGGGFVPTLLTPSVIELLRNRMVTNQLGVQTLSGLSGNVAIPRQTGAATAYHVSEIEALTASDQTIDQISLTPRRIGDTQKFSKQLILQSALDAEGFVRDDLLKVLAIKQDKAVLEGSGSANQPTGIFHTEGIGSVTFGATATWAKIVSFETKIAQANADIGAISWVTTPGVRGAWKTTPKIGTTFPVFLWADDNTVNGYPALVTNQIANDYVAFGNWNDCVVGMWGGLDIVVNPYTYAKQGEVEIVASVFMDVAVRHPVSFVWSADSGAQ